MSIAAEEDNLNKVSLGRPVLTYMKPVLSRP